MNYIQKFLLICSGSDLSLIKRAPSDVNKHLGIGGVILFTAILASLSAGYALETVFDNVYLAIGFGILWGLMIFNLDRYIVVSMKKSGNIFQQFLIATPRLILAVLLGIVISKPLELKIFNKEIDKQLNVIVNRNKTQLQDSVNVRYNQLLLPYSSQIKNIETENATLQASLDSASVELEKEVVGTHTSTTTGKIGYGPNAKRKAEIKAEKANNLAKFKEKSAIELAKYNKIIDSINKVKELDISQQNPVENKYNGFAARMQALDELGKNNETLWWANIFITLVFVSMEIAPVLVKLIAPKGPYDYLLEKHEYSYKVYSKESKDIMDLQSEANIETKKRKLTNDNFHENISQHE